MNETNYMKEVQDRVEKEFDAFKAYAESFPNACTLLVDTYNTLKSGIPNAIRVHNEVLKPMGKSLAGIRIDSGDLAYLTKEARKMLDAAEQTIELVEKLPQIQTMR